MRASNDKNYLLFKRHLLTIEYRLDFDEPVSQVYNTKPTRKFVL